MSESPSPFGPFVNHNHFAGYMELLFPIPVGLLVMRVARGPARLILVFAAFMMAIAAIVSLSRGGMMGLAAGMVALAVLGIVASRRRRERSRDMEFEEYREPRLSSLLSPAVIVIGLVALIGLGLFWIGPEKVVERVAQGKVTTADPDQESFFSSRGWIWKDTIRIFEAHPVLGAGLGTFASVYAIYSLRDGSMPATRAHNDYLQMLAESGIIGGLLVIWFIVLAARNTFSALRSRDRLAVGLAIGSSAALVSLMVHSILDFNLQIPSNALLFLMLGTLLACLAQFERLRRGEQGSLKEASQRVIADEPRSRVLAS
jgi:O-antigen ligase